MEVFLPIAQVFVNPIEILLLSAIVGVLSGLFGVGGGFLMPPYFGKEKEREKLILGQTLFIYGF